MLFDYFLGGLDGSDSQSLVLRFSFYMKLFREIIQVFWWHAFKTVYLYYKFFGKEA